MTNEIPYLQHINELEKIIAGRKINLSRKAKLAYKKYQHDLEREGNFWYSIDLNFGELPVFSENSLQELSRLTLDVRYKGKPEVLQEQESLEPFSMFVELFSKDVTKRNRIYGVKSHMGLLENENTVRQYKETLAKHLYCPTDADKKTIVNVSGSVEFPKCIEFGSASRINGYTRTHLWSINKKLDYVNQAMEIFFREQGFDTSEVDLTKKIDQIYKRTDKKEKDIVRTSQRTLRGLKKMKKVDLKDKQITQLKSYLPKLLKLDEGIQLLLETQRSPIIFDHLLKDFKLPNVQIGNISDFTKKMGEFANQDEPGKVFRRMESIFGDLEDTAIDSPELTEFFTQRKEYYQGLATSSGN